MPSYVRAESSHSVRVFWLEQDRLLEDIRRAAEKAGRVLWEDDRPFLERVKEWLEKFDLGFPVEVFPYTVAELSNPVAREALAKGIRLYASSRG